MVKRKQLKLWKYQGNLNQKRKKKGKLFVRDRASKNDITDMVVQIDQKGEKLCIERRKSKYVKDISNRWIDFVIRYSNPGITMKDLGERYRAKYGTKKRKK